MVALFGQIHPAHGDVLIHKRRFKCPFLACNRFYNRQQLAGEQAAFMVLIGRVIARVPVIKAQKRGALYRYAHQAVGVFHWQALVIQRGHAYKGQLIQMFIGQGQLRRLAKAEALNRGGQLPIFVKGVRAQAAFLIGKNPVAGDFRSHLLLANQLVVDIQRDAVLVAAHAHVNLLSLIEIPIGEEVQNRLFWVRPGGLEHIKAVLLEACGVQHAKIGVLGVIGRGFTQVILPCPDKLAQGEGRVAVVLDAVIYALGAPTGGAVAQGRGLHVVIRQHGLPEREAVDASALYGGAGFAAVNNPVRKLLMVLVVQELRVVVANRADLLRAFLGVFPGHVVGAQGG